MCMHKCRLSMHFTFHYILPSVLLCRIRHHRGVGGNFSSSSLSSNTIISDRHRRAILKSTKVSKQAYKLGPWLKTLSKCIMCCSSNIGSFPLDLHKRKALPYSTDLGLGHETCLSQWNTGGSNSVWVKAEGLRGILKNMLKVASWHQNQTHVKQIWAKSMTKAQRRSASPQLTNRHEMLQLKNVCYLPWGFCGGRVVTHQTDKS